MSEQTTEIRDNITPPPADLQNVRLETTEDGIAILTFDHPDKSANIFDIQTLVELEKEVDKLSTSLARGVIFISAKPSIFIAGADLKTLGEAKGEELRQLVEQGQMIFAKIGALEMPTVAAIHGACLGGGLELALACDARIASSDKATKIGLPETMLGIIPAWGGSSKMPRLIGVPKALDLILSGKQLAPSHALKLGVVDKVVPKERLREQALKLVSGELPKRKSHFLSNNPLSSAVIRSISRKKVLERTRGNYPAQEAAIDVVTRAGYGRLVDSLKREVDAAIKLAGTDAAANLMRIFQLQENAKKFRYDESVDLSDLPSIDRTAVIGAGVMGSGIAQWFAARGYPTILRDIDPARVSAGMQSVSKLFYGAVKKRIFSKHEAQKKMELISPSATPVPLRNCDIVVEAAVENLEIKKRIFADLCDRSGDDTILATNTSALPITELCTAEGVTHPGRIIGVHFFNPVSRMKLVEVVVTEHTAPETVEAVLLFVRRIGKMPVVVKDSPGFLVNRILMPYLIEAGALVDKGYDPKTIDEAMLDFGMPMGPIRLLDEIGLDVAAHVAETMSGAFGDRFAVPDILNKLLEAGSIGKKSGRGFYQYDGKKTTPAVSGNPAKSPSMSESEIAAKLAGLMVDEAKLCLEEGVAGSADDIDFAMILGTGFAPFRGGPLSYDKSLTSTKSD